MVTLATYCNCKIKCELRVPRLSKIVACDALPLKPDTLDIWITSSGVVQSSI